MNMETAFSWEKEKIYINILPVTKRKWWTVLWNCTYCNNKFYSIFYGSYQTHTHMHRHSLTHLQKKNNSSICLNYTCPWQSNKLLLFPVVGRLLQFLALFFCYCFIFFISVLWRLNAFFFIIIVPARGFKTFGRWIIKFNIFFKYI